MAKAEQKGASGAREDRPTRTRASVERPGSGGPSPNPDQFDRFEAMLARLEETRVAQAELLRLKEAIADLRGDMAKDIQASQIRVQEMIDGFSQVLAGLQMGTDSVARAQLKTLGSRVASLGQKLEHVPEFVRTQRDELLQRVARVIDKRTTDIGTRVEEVLGASKVPEDLDAVIAVKVQEILKEGEEAIVASLAVRVIENMRGLKALLGYVDERGEGPCLKIIDALRKDLDALTVSVYGHEDLEISKNARPSIFDARFNQIQKQLTELREGVLGNLKTGLKEDGNPSLRAQMGSGIDGLGSRVGVLESKKRKTALVIILFLLLNLGGLGFLFYINRENILKFLNQPSQSESK